VIPRIAEILDPESFPCPVCFASEGESCDRECYAGFERAIYRYVPEDLGRRRLEGNRHFRMAQEAAKLAASREPPPVVETAPVEAPARKHKKKSRR
jgi:hypothetical protein